METLSTGEINARKTLVNLIDTNAEALADLLTPYGFTWHDGTRVITHANTGVAVAANEDGFRISFGVEGDTRTVDFPMTKRITTVTAVATALVESCDN